MKYKTYYKDKFRDFTEPRVKQAHCWNLFEIRYVDIETFRRNQ